MTASSDTTIGIIGCGAMGSAVLTASVERLGLDPSQIVVFERDAVRAAQLREAGFHRVRAEPTNELKECGLVLLAIKPQGVDAVASSFRDLLSPECVLLSILAGSPVARLKALFGQSRSIVRCMPNLPALVQRSMCVYFVPDDVSTAQAERCRHLLSASGELLQVSSEELIDKATAISGSGPGYFFYFCSKLVSAAINLGFSDHEARHLVRSTLGGSAALWDHEPNTDPSFLSSRVASKGGTTEAAFLEFEAGDLGRLVEQGVQAALGRAKSLAKG